MATYSNYALRVPSSLMEDLRTAALRDGVSMNGFIVQAVAEKVAVLRARGLLPELSPAEQAAYLEARAARAQEGRFADIIQGAGTTTDILPGDEIPDGWFNDSAANEEPAAPAPRMGR